MTSWKTRDFSNRPAKLLRAFGGLKQLCEFRGRWIFIPTYTCSVYNTNVMQRNTFVTRPAIQLLSVYPSLAKQWKQREDRQNSVNNCKGLCVFRCDNFVPTFRFPRMRNLWIRNDDSTFLMKMFLFLAVFLDVKGFLYSRFCKNPNLCYNYLLLMDRIEEEETNFNNYAIWKWKKLFEGIFILKKQMS